MLTVSDFPRFSQKSPGRASLIWAWAFQPGGHKSLSKDKMESSQLLASPYLLESSPRVAEAFAALCIMAEPCSLCRCPSSWCLEMRHPGILTRCRNRGGLRHSAAGNSYPTIFRWPLNSLLWIAFERSIFLPPPPPSPDCSYREEENIRHFMFIFQISQETAIETLKYCTPY